MIEVLPELITVVFLIFCLIDCVQSEPMLIRNLPKLVWVILIIVLPVIGGVAWLVAGRPVNGRGNPVPWRSTSTAGFPEYERPVNLAARDIDEQLRRDQERVDREHEEALKRWEENLRARERKLEGPGTPEA